MGDVSITRTVNVRMFVVSVTVRFVGIKPEKKASVLFGMIF